MIPRWMHRAWAWVNGYFWMPCPNCGRAFGGHESSTGYVVTGPDRGLVTCPKCPGVYGVDSYGYRYELVTDANEAKSQVAHPTERKPVNKSKPTDTQEANQ